MSRVSAFRLATLVSFALGSVAALVGCGSDDYTDFGSETSEAEADVGSVGLSLELSPGVLLTGVDWEISGNGFSKRGATALGSSERFSLLIGGIPAGSGYAINLSAANGAAGLTCSGSATFDVTVGGTTPVFVQLRCRRAPRNGGVAVSGSVNACPNIDAISAAPLSAALGSSIALVAGATDLDSAPQALAYLWQSSAGQLSGAASSAASLRCDALGSFAVQLSVSDGDCGDTASFNVTCVAAAPVQTSVHINELESSGGTPGDWVELYNAGSADEDISGWVVLDNDDTHRYVLPAGTSVAAGGYLIIEEASLGFGLGAADSVRLLDDSNAPVESYTWAAHAATTYGRCPNGTGAFTTAQAVTKGQANACPPDPNAPPTTQAWPGANAVTVLDGAALFTGNLSGVTYEPSGSEAPGTLWAVSNNPSRLYWLVQDGATWAPAAGAEWAAGKTLHYANGAGAPDSEGVTFAEYGSGALYIATERDNEVSGTSRLSVLRVEPGTAGVVLNATHEWNLTASLPAVGANLGLEAISWIPDEFLVARGFIDENTGSVYAPANYPNHGSGVFLLGVEANGNIHAYVLDHATLGFQRIATFASGHSGMMGIEFDRETGYLWAGCDDTCQGRTNVLEIQTIADATDLGRFRVRHILERPSTMPNLNNEGISIAPEATCSAGQKAFFWTDDGDTGGNSLRGDTIPCGRFLP